MPAVTGATPAEAQPPSDSRPSASHRAEALFPQYAENGQLPVATLGRLLAAVDVPASAESTSEAIGLVAGSDAVSLSQDEALAVIGLLDTSAASAAPDEARAGPLEPHATAEGAVGSAEDQRPSSRVASATSRPAPASRDPSRPASSSTLSLPPAEPPPRSSGGLNGSLPRPLHAPPQPSPLGPQASYGPSPSAPGPETSGRSYSYGLNAEMSATSAGSSPGRPFRRLLTKNRAYLEVIPLRAARVHEAPACKQLFRPPARHDAYRHSYLRAQPRTACGAPASVRTTTGPPPSPSRPRVPTDGRSDRR